LRHNAVGDDAQREDLRPRPEIPVGSRMDFAVAASIREADRQEPRWRLEPSILRLFEFKGFECTWCQGRNRAFSLSHWYCVHELFEQTEEANKKANNFFLRPLLFRLKPN
jgi:hypothetical protein